MIKLLYIDLFCGAGGTTTGVEAASDADYLETMGESINLVWRVLDKYKKARAKAILFQSVRAEVSRRNRGRGLRARDIDKLTRQVIKKAKEELSCHTTPTA